MLVAMYIIELVNKVDKRDKVYASYNFVYIAIISLGYIL